MTFNNGERIVGFRLVGFLATIVYVLYIFSAYFPKAFRKVLTEEELNILTGVLTVIYIAVLLLPVIMRLHYISFSADARNITLRWYKTGLIPGESKSIEIPVERYAGYEIIEKKMSFRTYLVLYQIIQSQRAGYEPVCINSLSREQRKKLIETLNSYKSVS